MQNEPIQWDSTYYIFEYLVELQRAISLHDTDYKLPGHLNSNEWQLLAEPMQRVTMEISAKGAMVL